jgi:hypothetical protein
MTLRPQEREEGAFLVWGWGELVGSGLVLHLRRKPGAGVGWVLMGVGKREWMEWSEAAAAMGASQGSSGREEERGGYVVTEDENGRKRLKTNLRNRK